MLHLSYERCMYAPVAQWIEHRPPTPGCRRFDSYQACQMQRVSEGDFLHFSMSIGTNHDVRKKRWYVNHNKNERQSILLCFAALDHRG